jgi:hypothetical protein
MFIHAAQGQGGSQILDQTPVKVSGMDEEDSLSEGSEAKERLFQVHMP